MSRMPRTVELYDTSRRTESHSHFHLALLHDSHARVCLDKSQHV